jgi:hypothetical protein
MLKPIFDRRRLGFAFVFDGWFGIRLGVWLGAYLLGPAECAAAVVAPVLDLWTNHTKERSDIRFNIRKGATQQ